MKYECNYLNGKINGEYKKYYDNNIHQIASITNYINGIKNGIYISYYKDSDPIQIYETYNYVNDNIDGEYVCYKRNGRIDERCIYNNGDCIVSY